MKIAVFALALTFVLLVIVPSCESFSSFKAKVGSSSSASANLNEAIALYQQKYPQPTKPRKRAVNAAWGMPNRDIDGTKLVVAKDDTMGKTFAERSEKELKATFQELSKIYGAEDSLQMVKDTPLILAADRNNFQPSLVEFEKIFGERESKEMIKRNPGLLFVTPSDAAEATDLTMQFSYVISATRPLGPFLLYGTLGLLMEPAIELATGIPLKANLLSTFGF